MGWYRMRTYEMICIMRSVLLVFSLFFFALAHAETQMPAVQEYQLNNGLKLIVKEDHRAPVVVSQVWYKVGSSYEPRGITGISHALEHMMFKGTKNRKTGVFSRIIAQHGGRENAFTSKDYTGYYEIMTADKLPLAFELEADRMHNLLLNEEEFKKEIQVVMEERRLRTEDNPQALTYERFAAAAHVSTGYHHPPIGWMHDLKNMTVEDLRKWYKSWYGPNNAIVVVVGDVKPENVYALAKKYFGPISKIEMPVIKPQKPVKQLGYKEQVVRVPAKLPWVIMGYSVPVLKTAKEKWKAYALDVLAAVLSGGDSARLPKNVVRGKQIASAASAGYDPFSRLPSLFVLYGTPAQGHSVHDVKKALLASINQFKLKLISEKELDRVKAQAIADKIYKKDSMTGQASDIGSLEAVGLSWRDDEAYLKHIEAVTPEQIRDVAREYLNENNLTVAILKPLPMTLKKKRRPAIQVGRHDIH